MQRECWNLVVGLLGYEVVGVNNDRTEAAYRRTDLFERRRMLMQQWADYLGETV